MRPQSKFSHLSADADVCKYHLAGLSPYNLFKNTKSDLGEYNKIIGVELFRVPRGSTPNMQTPWTPHRRRLQGNLRSSPAVGEGQIWLRIRLDGLAGAVGATVRLSGQEAHRPDPLRASRRARCHRVAR